MLTEAIKESLEDIHIETWAPPVIRFRVGGVLRNHRPQRRLATLLITTFYGKVMASLDIAETHSQDGRMALRDGGRAVDVRVSTLPSRHGERVVLRSAR